MVVGTLSASAADDVFHALADRTRRDILRRTLRREASVSSLARRYPMSLTAVQKHVDVLAAARLVIKSPRGREQLVRANVDRVRRAVRLLDRYEEIWLGRIQRMSGLLSENHQGAAK